MNCLYCGVEIEQGDGKPKKFCKVSHRVMYSREQKALAAGKSEAAPAVSEPAVTAVVPGVAVQPSEVVPVKIEGIPGIKRGSEIKGPDRSIIVKDPMVGVGKREVLGVRTGERPPEPVRVPIDLTKPPYTVKGADGKENINLDTPVAQWLKFYWP